MTSKNIPRPGGTMESLIRFIHFPRPFRTNPLSLRPDTSCLANFPCRSATMPPVKIHPTKISARSPRGLGVKIRGRSASRVSRGPMSSAKNRCCLRSSTITSGEGGADFSARRGAESRMEKFTAKIKIQTAANPAHAAGAGQSNEDRKWRMEDGRDRFRWRVTGDG